MRSERILFVVKRTKWERDRVRYGSERTARKIYVRQNNAFERILKSHDRQLRHLETVRTALPDARFIYREELPFVESDQYDLLVSFGGDNHFVNVSHYASEHWALLGLNSDPESSTGALLYFTPQSFLTKLDVLRSGEPELEAWTRIGCEIEHADGRRQRVAPCTSEISVRSSFHDLISRYHITKNDGPLEEQKSSGLLLASGAGSTGWFRNCHPLSEQRRVAFPKDAPFFRVVAREVGLRARQRYRYLHVTVDASESLQLISEMDGEITVDADPERAYEFGPGAIARFFLSDERLHVVRDFRPVKTPGASAKKATAERTVPKKAAARKKSKS